MEKVKKYKYTYMGTTKMSVMHQTVRGPGDIAWLPINWFRHKDFTAEDSSLVSVEDLKNKGKGKVCLMIGGGQSSVDLQDKIKEKYDDVILVNINKTEIDPDYVIYLEMAYIDWMRKNPLKKGVVLIGNQLALDNRTDLFYSAKDVVEGHGAGFYALQIADKIMNYKKIILIGFDMCGDDRNWKPLIEDYNKIEWGKNIINMNPESKLILNSGGK